MTALSNGDIPVSSPEPVSEPASANSGELPERTLGMTRLAIGLVQGLLLFALAEAEQLNVWPSTAPALYTPMLLLSGAIPILLIGGLGQMRVRPLLIWAASAAVVIALLGVHDALRLGPAEPGVYRADRSPSMALVGFGLPALFIAHHLVVAASEARKWIAPYPRYFDIGWTSAVQIGLSVAFVGVMWIVLFLGAQLFKLVGLRIVEEIITKTWFAFPVSCITFAAAVHITDIRSRLVVGARALVLVLLSWLMPVMALFGAFFLMALPFTGLQPLWDTGSATPILLSSAAAVVALINAAYQDGDPAHMRAVVLRWASIIACIVVLPLLLIAAFGLAQRIGQYGLTPERVGAVAAVIIALVYGVGYLVGQLPQLSTRRLFERTNIAAAFVSLVVFLLVFSPVADPARLAVDDQVGRLMAGKTAPDKFDYRFLRWEAGRYGIEALARLKTATGVEGADKIAQYAAAAEVEASRYDSSPIVPPADRITVYPAGTSLPADFPMAADTQWPGPQTYSRCHSNETEPCHAFVVDIDGDGSAEVLMGPASDAAPETQWRNPLDVFRKTDGAWKIAGQLDSPCTKEGWDVLRAGDAKPAQRTVTDLTVAGAALTFRPTVDEATRCPT